MRHIELFKNLKNKSVLVLGAGLSGVAASRLLTAKEAKVTLIDDRELVNVLENIRELGGVPSSVEIQHGISDKSLAKAELIILSPGIPLSHPAITAAKMKRIPILNEIDLAATYLPPCKIVGVTGSNGKSTTTSILGSIVKEVDQYAFVGGNLGTPLCSIVLNKIHPSIIIIELSSFQLEIISVLKLDAAIITNLSPDHLDRYDTVLDYYQTKAKIINLLRPNGTLILNFGDANSMIHLTKNQPIKRLDFNVPASVNGIAITEGELKFKTDFANIQINIDPEKFLGPRNHQNVAAAVAAAIVLGIPEKKIAAGLKNYQAIPHRLETLGFINQVRWVNDSKATNVESAIAAVNNFAHGIHLILGGVGKKSSYEPLKQACFGRVKTIYAIGADAELIMKSFADFNCISANDLTSAAQLAYKNAQPNDVILLAPACASYDQFKNFAHRGDTFRQLFHNAKKMAKIIQDKNS